VAMVEVQRHLFLEEIEADEPLRGSPLSAAGFPDACCDRGHPLTIETVRQVTAPNMHFTYVPFVVVTASCHASGCCAWGFQRKGRWNRIDSTDPVAGRTRGTHV